eukprot:4357914-Pleurochrysis_carterae.AAC.1
MLFASWFYAEQRYIEVQGAFLIRSHIGFSHSAMIFVFGASLALSSQAHGSQLHFDAVPSRARRLAEAGTLVRLRHPVHAHARSTTEVLRASLLHAVVPVPSRSTPSHTITR